MNEAEQDAELGFLCLGSETSALTVYSPGCRFVVSIVADDPFPPTVPLVLVQLKSKLLLLKLLGDTVALTGPAQGRSSDGVTAQATDGGVGGAPPKRTAIPALYFRFCCHFV